jgi:hypothetical protein
MAAFYPIGLAPLLSAKTVPRRNQVPCSKAWQTEANVTIDHYYRRERMCSILYFKGCQMSGKAACQDLAAYSDDKFRMAGNTSTCTRVRP